MEAPGSGGGLHVNQVPSSGAPAALSTDLLCCLAVSPQKLELRTLPMLITHGHVYVCCPAFSVFPHRELTPLGHLRAFDYQFQNNLDIYAPDAKVLLPGGALSLQVWVAAWIAYGPASCEPHSDCCLSTCHSVFVSSHPG